MRIRFYFRNFDVELWKYFPCRINKGDFFYFDAIIQESEMNKFKENQISDLQDGDASVLYCKDVGFDKDSEGIFQSVYIDIE